MKTLNELVKVKNESKVLFVSKLEKAGQLSKKLKYLLKEADKNQESCFIADNKKELNLFR
jgi:hypothetical protein